jgi:hypothetical protein
MKARLELQERTGEGEPSLGPIVWLLVRDRDGTLAKLLFRVDTQADAMAIPIRLAEREAIPFSRRQEGTARGITGVVKKYRDRVRVVIAGREHDWPCDFTEPALDPQTGQLLPELPPVLGLAGFLQEYAIAVDTGDLIITRIGPVRRWLRRCLHWLWKRSGRVHPPRRPL